MTNRLLVYLFISVALASCKKDDLAPTIPINETVDTIAMLKYSGSFESGPYGTTAGNAEVYTNATESEVKLVNFNSTNGPDLHVFLSKEPMPINFIDLGSLKSTNGNQVYSIPGNPELSEYKYISIHCVEYNHLFGYAKLN
jgi:nitrous oxide reductase accessory protein NosL